MPRADSPSGVDIAGPPGEMIRLHLTLRVEGSTVQ